MACPDCKCQCIVADETGVAYEIGVDEFGNEAIIVPRQGCAQDETGALWPADPLSGCSIIPRRSELPTFAEQNYSGQAGFLLPITAGDTVTSNPSTITITNPAVYTSMRVTGNVLATLASSSTIAAGEALLFTGDVEVDYGLGAGFELFHTMRLIRYPAPAFTALGDQYVADQYATRDLASFVLPPGGSRTIRSRIIAQAQDPETTGTHIAWTILSLYGAATD